MKLKELFRSICCIIGLIACAGNKNHSKNDQIANVAVDSSYKVAVAFGSRCCGTVSSDFLGKFLKDFNRIAAVKVSADIAEGCGREGEFYILFKVDEKVKILFIEKLIPLVNEEETNNRKKDASSGDVEIKYDVLKTAVGHCRLGVRSWKP